MREEDKIIRVYSGLEIKVILLKDQLEQIGISGLIQNESNSGALAGFFGGGPAAIHLYIKGSDLEKAEQMIREFHQLNN